MGGGLRSFAVFFIASLIILRGEVTVNMIQDIGIEDREQSVSLPKYLHSCGKQEVFATHLLKMVLFFVFI